MQAYKPYRAHQVIEHTPFIDRVDFDIFLFINTKSGGQAGMRFMALEMRTAQFTMHGLRVDVSFFNLNDNNSKTKGLQKLKKSQAMGHSCRAIVCGGDGTVLWVVKQIIDYGIDIHKVPIGVIPIGTGNDFSREMGWGGKQQTMIGEKLQKLKELVFEWIDAEVVNFDVWEMTMTLHENGVFKKVSGKGEEVIDGGVKVFRKSFTNYCSIGMDGRVGYSFDKHRGKSRAMNLIIYACIGFGKSCKPNAKMDKTIQSMTQTQQHVGSLPKNGVSVEMVNLPTNLIQNSQRAVNHSMLQQPPTTSEIIFNHDPNCQFHLKPGFGNIVALNINSFMGGCKDMWYSGDNAVTNTNQKKYQASRYDDGMLEFLAWKSEVGLAYERAFKMGAKVAQGRGPFVFGFVKQEQEDWHTYFQIDGEFYKAYHPKEMTMKRCAMVPDGYIRVLKFRGRRRKDLTR